MKVKTGENVNLLVKVRTKGGNSKGTRPRTTNVFDPYGPLPEEPLEDALRRRILKGINFYALNLVKPEDSDEYKDIDWYVNPSITHTINRAAIEGQLEQVILDVGRFTESDLEGLYEKIFEVPLEDWKKRYYKIPYDNRIPFTIHIKDKEGDVQQISDENDAVLKYEEDGEILYRPLDSIGIEWTRKGLMYDTSLDEEEEPIFGHIAINTSEDSPYFEFDTSSEDYKITEEYDYDAEEVEWKIKPNMDIFLVPKFGLYYSTTNGITDNTVPLDHADVTWHHNLLGLQYRAAPTQKHPKFVNPDIDVVSSETDPTGEFQAFIDHLKAFTGSRAYLVERIYFYPLPTATQHHSTDGDSGIKSAATYPVIGESTFHYLYRFISYRTVDLDRKITVQPDDYPSEFNSFFINEITTPQLVAVIKIGSKAFYVWNKQTGLDMRAEIFQYTGAVGELRIFYNT